MSVKQSARLKHRRRIGEPWISHNRVLNGNLSSNDDDNSLSASRHSSVNGKKGSNIGRNPNFDTDETKVLIQLWGDPKVQRTLITTHKKHAVICQLAGKMQEYGYSRSPEEITTRIKNLKCFYNRLKKEIELGEAPPEPTWKHYAEMDAIMTRPIFSVRPNEVPAPSLKYQLEKAREEREERKRKILEEGGTVSESDAEDNLDDILALEKPTRSSRKNSKSSDIEDDGIIPDAEVDMGSNEALAVIANAASAAAVSSIKRRKLSRTNEEEEPLLMAKTDNDSNCASDSNNIEIDEQRLQIKEEFESIDDCLNELTALRDAEKIKDAKRPLERQNSGQSEKEKTENNRLIANSDDEVSLIIPKDEPIDVDAEDDDLRESATKLAPGGRNAKAVNLADMINLSNQNLGVISVSSGSAILVPTTCITTNASMTGSNNNSSTQHNLNPSSKCSTNAVAPQPQQTQGKISLVPTNFLMQPKNIVNSSNYLTATPPPKPHTPTLTMATTPSGQQIHLVPANALNSQGQLQQRILLSGSSGATAMSTVGSMTNQSLQSAQNASIMTSGHGGMKVLLVNAASAANLTQSLNQGTAGVGLGQSLNTVLPIGGGNATMLLQSSQKAAANQQQQQQHVEQQQQQQQSQNIAQRSEVEQRERTRREMEKRVQMQREHRLAAKREELQNKREATNIRILLRQLLKTQGELTEIEHQRLTLERERLTFEKQSVERFFKVLPGLLASQQPSNNNQVQKPVLQQQQYQQHQPHHTAAVSIPKLIFTTTSMAASSAASNLRLNNNNNNNVIYTATTTPVTASPILTRTIIPKTTTTTSTLAGDIQLLTPKIEKDD